MSDIHDNAIQNILRSGITYSTKYKGKTTRDKWKCDAWIITFSSGNIQHNFEFYTGLGLRHKPDIISRQAQSKLNPRCIAWHNIEKTRKPKPPTAASVLCSLILASSACEMSFASWCEDLGFDRDYIKARKAYNDCQENTDKLRQIFTNAQLSDIREALADY